eukprot:10788951-Lingulodinium_polyedra.AAC.1
MQQLAEAPAGWHVFAKLRCLALIESCLNMASHAGVVCPVRPDRAAAGLPGGRCIRRVEGHAGRSKPGVE